MRIGIEAQRLFRKKKHGMEVVALELIRHLQALDRENQYFIFVKDDEDRCIQETDNFRIVTVPGLSYPDWEQIQLPKAIKEYNLDVLHCTCNTAPRRVGVPLILTLHDIIYLESVSFLGTAYQNFGNLYRRWVVPQVVKSCQKIVTVSHYEQQCILDKLPVEADNIRVVYNAINSSFRVIEEEQLVRYQQAYQLPDRFILYFANPSPKKNAANTFVAYQHYVEMSEHPLPLVVADTSQNYVNQLLKKLDLGHLASRVQVIDFIPFATLPYVYNLASLFLYTSKRESFGMPILEAMACGTPVITSTTSAMPEIASPAALLADPLDPPAIGAQMHQLLAHQAQQFTLIEEGLKRAAEFTWEATAKQMLGIYEDIAQNENHRTTETMKAKHLFDPGDEYSKAVDHKRLQFIIKQLEQQGPTGGTVLDVGCGNGIMSRAIAQHGYQVFGIDISAKAIEKARAVEHDNVRFEVMSADELVADGSTYDAVICSEVLEHLSDPSQLLKTLHALLSDDGVLVVTVPNGRGPRELMITQPMQKLQQQGGILLKGAEAAKKALGYTGKTEQSDADDLSHVQYFTKNSLRRLLNTHLFRMQAFEHANFLADVFPVSWLANRSYWLQSVDCRVADTLPHQFTGGFYSAWTKVRVDK